MISSAIGDVAAPTTPSRASARWANAAVFRFLRQFARSGSGRSTSGSGMTRPGRRNLPTRRPAVRPYTSRHPRTRTSTATSQTSWPMGVHTSTWGTTSGACGVWVFSRTMSARGWRISFESDTRMTPPGVEPFALRRARLLDPVRAGDAAPPGRVVGECQDTAVLEAHGVCGEFKHRVAVHGGASQRLRNLVDLTGLGQLVGEPVDGDGAAEDLDADVVHEHVRLVEHDVPGCQIAGPFRSLDRCQDGHQVADRMVRTIEVVGGRDDR